MRRGFTLIELAIVLVIFGLIATMLLPSLVTSVKRGKMTEARATLYAVRDGVIGYALANGNNLPTNLDPLGKPVDPWQNAINYTTLLPLGATICNATSTTGIYTTPESQSVTNVAFVLSSNGPNSKPEVTLGTLTNGSIDSDDLLQYVTLPHLKTLLCDAPTGNGPNVGGEPVTWPDFIINSSKVGSGSNIGAVINTASNTISLGNPNGQSEHSYGCVWYAGSKPTGVCQQGKCDFGKGLRAYFTFTVRKVGATLADGFTFAVISAQNNEPQSCGGYGSALGYAATGINVDDNGVLPFVLPPKIGVEFDFYSSTTDPGSNLDHLGILYWGSNIGATDLARGADDFWHNQNPADDSPRVPQYVRTTSQNYFDETGTVHYPVRLEIVRNASTRTYVTHVWFNCVACDDLSQSRLGEKVPANQLYAASEYLTNNATLSESWHAQFDKIMFGWTQGTGGSRQDVTIKNATFFFPQ